MDGSRVTGNGASSKGFDRVTHSIRAIGQHEIGRSTPEQRRQLGELIDKIVEDVEHFIATHRAEGAKRVERDRHLVDRVYDLRQAFESISRGVTANPMIEDVRWAERVENANRRKP